MFNIGAARDWEPDDILTIPAPASGTSTKLNSAVKVMADFMQSEYDSGVFNGERDQYVMLVLSDGADNYSFFDNSHLNASLTTSSGARRRTMSAARASSPCCWPWRRSPRCCRWASPAICSTT